MPVSGLAPPRRSLPMATRLATTVLLLGTVCAWPMTSRAGPTLTYVTLDFGTDQTFLTGIRGDNIVGNYIIPGTTNTGGLLYNSATGTWSPFPFKTPNHSNFPGSISSSPYGPSFGSADGILRVVGSYKTSASSPDLGYLYDGAAAPGEKLLTLVYPDPSTLFTIAHSNFGNTVVGNYDTGPLTGNAFIYDIPTGTYVTNNKPGAISTTAYGVWADKIAGGYGAFGPDGEPGFEHGYIYDVSTDTWTTYDHPGAVFTHFEGITGAGRGDEYNLIADWFDLGGPHAAVLHVDKDGNQTWIPIEVPGATTTSVNSIHQNKVIGVYTDADGVHGFEVVVPGIYNPISNTAKLVTAMPGIPAISAGVGDDVVNDATILTTGTHSSGIRSHSYGVIYNNALVSVTGAGSAAVEMHGAFGTLLNGGTLKAAPGGDAIRANGNAAGTVVVNTGVIDGRVRIMAGPDARFENSGWMGVTGAGAGTNHVISGTFAQTAAGTLALRVRGGNNDSLDILGSARLAGTVMPAFQPGDLDNSYTILSATVERTGKFDTLTPVGLPGFVSASLDYTPSDVSLQVEADLAQLAGLTGNQRAVGGALDHAFNTGGGIPDGLNAALFGLSDSQLPAALDALSGEIYASEHSVLINEALYGREALLGRLRQMSYEGHAGPAAPDAALGYAGAPVIPPAAPRHAPDPTFWAQGLGVWSDIDGNKNASAVSGSYGGVLAGTDASAGDNWKLGLALGYTQSSVKVADLSSSADVQTGLFAGYAAGSMGAWKLRAGGIYGLNFVDAGRSVSFPGFADHVKANYQAGTSQVFGEIGYGAAVRAVALEPFAGLAWVHLHTQGFTESGGAAALKGSASSSDVGNSTLGLRVATNYAMANGMILTPRLSVAWQYAFGDLTPSAALAFAGTSGANFTVTGVPLATNTALINAGADLRISPNARLGLSYFGQFAGSASDNAVWGNFAWAF